MNLVAVGDRATHGAGGSRLAEAIRAVRFHGLLGLFTFDKTGVGIHSTASPPSGRAGSSR